MFISEEFKQELKNRTDIVDVISSYVHLKRTGRNMQGLCPFHNEDTPSFSVSPEKNMFHCFGCKASGDVITFIMRIENLEYLEAIKFLAQRAGLEIPENSAKDERISRLKNRIYEANREAARFYNQQLYTQQGARALKYLYGRGLTDTTIRHFGLGYSPQSRFELLNHLKSKGFKEDELVKANLVNKSKKGEGFYDSFSDRVMFPIIDLRGNVIAFGGRVMAADIQPKYLNTSDTPVFSKKNNIYALNFAKKKIRNDRIILVEGYMDVIAMHRAGFEETVATLGTALTNEQAKIISRYCKEIVICYDSDNAGRQATERAIDIFRSVGLNIKILTVPDGKDPDEFMKTYGDEGHSRFSYLLSKCGNDIEYRINNLRSKYDIDDVKQKIQFLTECAKILAAIENSIERDAYIHQLSDEYIIDRTAFSEQVQKYIKNNKTQEKKQYKREMQAISAQNDKIETERAVNLRACSAEEALLAVLLTNADASLSVCKILSSDAFITPFNKKVYEKIKERAQKNLPTETVDISGDFSIDENSRISCFVYKHIKERDPFLAVKEYIDILEEESENQNFTPDRILMQDDEAIMEQIRKNMERKK